MPVRMLNFIKEPPPPKKINGWIKRTQEYLDLCMSLGAGLGPQEYLDASFPEGHPIHKTMKQPLNCLQLAMREKIKELGLPYDCYCSNKTLYIVKRSVIA